MKNVFIHMKEKNRFSLLRYFLFLIPLLLYGIYKNGFLLYQKDFISLLSVFKPIVLMGIAFLFNGIVKFIFERNIKIDYSYLNAVILALFMPPSINVFLYAIIIFIGLFLMKIIEKKVHINQIVVLKLLLVLVLFLMGKYGYENVGEQYNIYAFNLLDWIVGRNVGGIAASSILLGGIIYALLAIFNVYKRLIPILSYTFYVLCCIPFVFLFHSVDYHVFFSSTVILAFILVATDTLSSSYSVIGQILYSIFLGIISAILTVYLPYEGVFIAILIVSLLSDFFDKIARKINCFRFKNRTNAV